MCWGAKTSRLISTAMFLSASGLWGSSAAAATIDVGVIEILPQAGQTADFSVSGTEEVLAIEFVIQVGDGGSDLLGTDEPGVDAPEIMDVDLITGTIFDGVSSDLQFDLATDPLAWRSLLDGPTAVTANGKIATVEFDATGLAPGTEIPLRLSNVAMELFPPDGFSTNFTSATGVRIDPTINDAQGMIRIVPEPGTLALLVVGLLGLAVRWRRR